MMFTKNMANTVGVFNTQPPETQTSPNGLSQEQQKKVARLSYLKAHADIIVVGLLIAYLSYSLYVLNKSNGKK